MTRSFLSIIRALLGSLGCFVFCANIANGTSVTEQELIAKILIALPRYIHHDSAAARLPTLCVEGDQEMALITQNMNAQLKVYTNIAKEYNPSCGIIYSRLPPQARRSLVRTAGRPILVVSSHKTFVDEGGVIGLVVVNGSVQVELNISAAKERHIHFIPDLIELSTRIVQ